MVWPPGCVQIDQVVHSVAKYEPRAGATPRMSTHLDGGNDRQRCGVARGTRNGGVNRRFDVETVGNLTLERLPGGGAHCFRHGTTRFCEQRVPSSHEKLRGSSDEERPFQNARLSSTSFDQASERSVSDSAISTGSIERHRIVLPRSRKPSEHGLDPELLDQRRTKREHRTQARALGQEQRRARTRTRDPPAPRLHDAECHLSSPTEKRLGRRKNVEHRGRQTRSVRCNRDREVFRAALLRHSQKTGVECFTRDRALGKLDAHECVERFRARGVSGRVRLEPETTPRSQWPATNAAFGRSRRAASNSLAMRF